VRIVGNILDRFRFHKVLADFGCAFLGHGVFCVFFVSPARTIISFPACLLYPSTTTVAIWLQL